MYLLWSSQSQNGCEALCVCSLCHKSWHWDHGRPLCAVGSASATWACARHSQVPVSSWASDPVKCHVQSDFAGGEGMKERKRWQVWLPEIIHCHSAFWVDGVSCLCTLGSSTARELALPETVRASRPCDTGAILFLFCNFLRWWGWNKMSSDAIGVYPAHSQSGSEQVWGTNRNLFWRTRVMQFVFGMEPEGCWCWQEQIEAVAALPAGYLLSSLVSTSAWPVHVPTAAFRFLIRPQFWSLWFRDPSSQLCFRV